MITVMHVKGAALEDVAGVVEAHLAGEGYTVAEGDVAPVDRFDTSVREIVLAAQDGFVSVVDHPFADTAWGEALSGGLGLPVLTLSGECDHAFYSDITLHVGGVVSAASKVPADAVLGADGRHRITPTFLADLVPEAREALAAGVVVNPLGGEENLDRVGALLGISRPLVRASWDGEPAPTDRRIVFQRIAGAPRRALDLGAMLQKFTANLDDDARAQLEAMMTYEPTAEEQADLPRLFVRPGAMQDCFAGTEDGWIDVEVSLSSLLPSADGLAIELDGPGLDLVALRGEAFVGEERHPIVDRTIVLPAVKLVSSRSPGPRLLAGALNVGLVEEAARVYIRIPVALRAPGAGAITFTIRTADVVETASLDLVVRRRPRRPVLPAGGEERHVRDLERYAATSSINGWVAFGAPWSDLSARVTPMLRDLAGALRRASGHALDEVSVHASSNETLRFPRALEQPEAWAKIEAELMRGASVSIDGWDMRMCEPDERINVRIELAHHRDGAHPGWPARDAAGELVDLPRVALAWSITTPRASDQRALVAEVSRSVVLNAGHVAGNLGGFVQTGEMGGGTGGSTPYEDMLGDRRLKQAHLASHVRTPAWCVLAPRAAATKLGEPTSPRLRTMRTTHGLFAWATEADPIAWADEDREAMERFFLPAVPGTRVNA